MVFIFKTFSPFGLKAIYKFNFSDKGWIHNISGLSSVFGLGTLKENTIKYLELDDDSAKFSLKIPSSPNKVSKAVISLMFKTNREARIGVTNNITKNIDSVAFYEPILQDLSWQSIENNGLILFQKNNKYRDIQDFLSDITVANNDGKGVGVFDYRIEPVIEKSEIPDGNFVLNSKLRGSHTFYVYVANSPLIMNISKADLNQYIGSDEVNIIGSKDNKIIFSSTIVDDGIKEATNKSLQPQSAEIVENLDKGIYEVFIDCESDNIISNININQSLVVADSVFFADNPDIYPLATEFKSNNLYTDASRVDITLAHESQKQDITINNDSFYINEKNKSIEINSGLSDISSTTSPSKELSKIQTKRNDIRISTDGYLSFSEKAFFQPFLKSVSNIYNPTELNSIDYIIGKYKKALEKDGWYEQTLSIPLDDSHLNKGSVEFILFSNDKSNSNNVNWLKIKNLQITLE